MQPRYIAYRMTEPTAASMFHRDKPIVARRGVHLDLKGVPPTPGRLIALLDLFAAARINCILVEWEDSFPWTVDQRFRSETAYAPDVLRKFHQRAAVLGIEIIPLVQSLGHMETPLRLAEYAHLREIADRNEGLNPLADGARALVERMVDDVIRESGPINYFHLGGDEAFTFGQHPHTREFIAQHGKAALYLRHIEPLLDHLIARGIRPILWHDMMSDWDAPSLRRLGEKADLMFWTYQGDLESARHGHDARTLARMIDAGVKIWGASAYKGADGADADLPDPAKRIENHLAWTRVAAQLHIDSIVMTGWSRYTTSRVQCEPLDGALDVLLNCAAILHDGDPPHPALVDAMLRQTGEQDRFLRCRDALQRLASSRCKTWNWILAAREQIACEQLDHRRAGSGILAELYRLARESLGAAESACGDLKIALNGLIEPVWIDRYCRARLIPLEEAIGSSSTK